MKKRTKIWIYPLVIMGVLLMLTSSCTKSTIKPFGNNVNTFPPVVHTVQVTDITATTAVSGGDVQNFNGTGITAEGICWGDEFTVPTTSDAHIEIYSNSESFRITMTGLKPNTSYVVRAYAKNSNGTGYGAGMNFKTHVR